MIFQLDCISFETLNPVRVMTCGVFFTPTRLCAVLSYVPLGTSRICKLSRNESFNGTLLTLEYSFNKVQ